MSNIITMDDDGSALCAPPDLSDLDQQVRILLFHSWVGPSGMDSRSGTLGTLGFYVGGSPS